jgi:hypothetical protein
MSVNENVGDYVAAIKDNISAWVATRFEWLRLEILERTSTTGAGLIYGMIAINFVFFAMLFAFLALGFWLGDLMDNNALGFALVTGIYLVLLLVMLVFRKPIIDLIRNMFLKEMYPEFKNQTNEQKSDGI